MTRPALPQNYDRSRVLYESFSTPAEWTPTNGTVSADTEHYIQGTQCVKLTASSGLIARMTKPISSENFASKIKRTQFWCYVPAESVSLIDSITLIFAADAGATIYAKASWAIVSIVAGWNRFDVAAAGWTLVGGFQWNSNPIILLKVNLDAATGATPNISMGALYFIDSIPSVSFHFDDGVISQYTEAYSCMKSKGLAGTIYVVSDDVGSANHCSLAQLQEMYADGWAIANHTKDHTALATLSLAEQIAELSTCYDYLISHGMPRCARHVAYPTGSHNVDTLTAMALLGMTTGRTTNSGYHWMPPAHPYELKTYNLGYQDTLETAKNRIDAAITSGYSIIFLGHTLVTSGPANTQEWTIANFQALVDYVVSRKIKCVTIDELWECLSNPRYRSVPLIRA
jgi:peptidoglycan/xylan/chitin deacetylase (PgdA/CDA1 family)